MQLDLFSTPESVIVTVEEWRDLSDFPRYEVSNMGRFRRRATGKLIGGTLAHNGYLHIGLVRNGRQVTKLAHRLVAEAFLDKPSLKHTDVNHRNKQRSDNRASNLEWVTRSQNSRHAKAKHA